MKRVLYVIRDLGLGGAEKHLADVLPRLSSLGYCPVVYSLAPGGFYRQVLLDAGVQVLALPLLRLSKKLPKVVSRGFRLICNCFYLWYSLVRLRPAIVHFFLPEAYITGGLCSLFAGFHLRIMSRRSLNDYQIKHPLAARFERLLHTRMNMVLGNSQAVLHQLSEEGVPESRLRLIYNGVGVSSGGDEEKQKIRARLSIPADMLVFVMVANLIPYKGHMDLLRALVTLQTKLKSPWLLVLVGRDEGVWKPFSQEAKRLHLDGRTLWLGEIENAGTLFPMADIGILCSNQEGFSNSLLEGMAAGVPMVVTNVGGNAEAVVDGETGFVVPPGCPASLSDALMKLAEDVKLRCKMGRAGKDRARLAFSMELCVDRYDQLYQGLVAVRGSQKKQSMKR